jgi:serine protease Do
VGEWVLAVGNPFNLASTVTAGIVSAKGRNINILKEESAIESFIQTDAAVNQGNSGGALVNLRGNLVGINTAIATPSGSYAGYAFAVPVNIAKKVIEDLKSYGSVQRAYLGINTRDISPEIAGRLKLKNMNGVFIEQVTVGGAGAEAGLKKDDIITEVNGYKVNTVPEFKEKVARFRPGDVIGITYLRNGQMAYTKMVLKNAVQTTQINAKPKEELEKLLGARFEELTPVEMSSLGQKNGLKVTRLLENGLLQTATSMKVGFIVLKVNNEPIISLDDFYAYIQKIAKGDGVMLDGMYPNDKSKKLYAFSMK